MIVRDLAHLAIAFVTVFLAPEYFGVCNKVCMCK